MILLQDVVQVLDRPAAATALQDSSARSTHHRRPAWTPQGALSINARKNPVLHPCLILCPLIGAEFLGAEPVVITLTKGEQRDDEDKVGPSPGISEVAEYQGN